MAGNTVALHLKAESCASFQQDSTGLGDLFRSEE
jgi:hypothetical protein